MSCLQISELLPWFIQGNLPDRKRVEVARHLSGCPACVAELKECLAVSAVIRREVAEIDACGTNISMNRRAVPALKWSNALRDGLRKFEGPGGSFLRGSWFVAVGAMDAISSQVGILKPAVNLLRLSESLVNVRTRLERWRREPVGRLVRGLSYRAGSGKHV